MIRQLAIFALMAVCLTRSTTAEAVSYSEEEIFKGQKTLFEFMSYRFKANKIDAELYKKGRDYDFEAHLGEFSPEYKLIVEEFLIHYRNGMLPRGRIFSIHCAHEKPATVALFNVFYYAPDIWTLNYLSLWASIHVNEYQFYYVLRAAMYHRMDTKYITLPPYFEIFPEYFVNSDVMKQVYDFKIHLNDIGDELEDGSNHIIPANYTHWYIKDSTDNEHRLNYYLEDITLNGFYLNFNLRYPGWMSAKDHSSLPLGLRGETWFYCHRMLLNRYQLERMSNGLDEIEHMDWTKPIPIGYTPYMSYPDGLHFPQRKGGSQVPEWYNDYLQVIQELDSRITEVLDSGYIFTEGGKFENINGNDAINIIGNLLQGNNESSNYNYYKSFDTIVRFVLGGSPKPYDHHQLLPSALEHYSTSMRDPAFYRILELIAGYYWRFQKNLGPYPPKELAFPGVAIKSVDIVEKDLTTYFEQDETLIDRYWYRNGKKMAKITVRQPRLAYKPFTYKIVVNSDKKVKASVRIFIGPKSEIVDNYKNFFEVDFFVEELEKGENIIKRKSDAGPWFAPDFRTPDTFETLPKNLEEGLEFERKRFGYPARLLLPKGTEGGMDFQFFVYTNEYVPDAKHKVEPLLGARDANPLGFPLNRPLYNYTMPNMYRFDAKIYHKTETQLNLTTE